MIHISTVFCNEIKNNKNFFPVILEGYSTNAVGVLSNGKIKYISLDNGEISQIDTPFSRVKYWRDNNNNPTNPPDLSNLEQIYFLCKNRGRVEELLCKISNEVWYISLTFARQHIELQNNDNIFGTIGSDTNIYGIKNEKIFPFDNSEIIKECITDLPRNYDNVFPLKEDNWYFGFGIVNKNYVYVNLFYEEPPLSLTQRTHKFFCEGKAIYKLPNEYDVIIEGEISTPSYDDEDKENLLSSFEIIYIQDNKIKVYDVIHQKILKTFTADEDFRSKPRENKHLVVSDKDKFNIFKVDNSNKTIKDLLKYFNLRQLKTFPGKKYSFENFFGAIDGASVRIGSNSSFNEVQIYKFDTSDPGSRNILKQMEETNTISVLGTPRPVIVNGSFVIMNYLENIWKDELVQAFSEF